MTGNYAEFNISLNFFGAAIIYLLFHFLPLRNIGKNKINPQLDRSLLAELIVADLLL